MNAAAERGREARSDAPPYEVFESRRWLESVLRWQELGRHEAAVKLGRRALAECPPDARAGLHYQLALSLDALERPQDAAYHFAQAIDGVLAGL
jgi:tetratricopeptide (TPR) repeat protein